MRKRARLTRWVLLIALLMPVVASAQVSTETIDGKLDQILKEFNALQHRLDVVEKGIDDLMWQERLGDIAIVDKVFMYGPPLARESNPTGQGAGNPVKLWSYVFIPSDFDPSEKYPLIVFPHGGVHASFTTYYTHIVRELVTQGYVIVAVEYRGSTGYGGSMYRKIDYGGLEVEDTDFSRQFMLDNYSFINKNRVGIIGWSHGGLITLMNIFDHPDHYQAAFAGVPVSDVIARMGYKNQAYRDLYEADYHIGKSADEDVKEYRRRSPVWNVHKMKDTPLLIHTNTNDEDVNVLEVEHLIRALKAEGKKFEYKVFDEMPGGHSFDRMDTKAAREIRLDIYKFLARHLNPANPFKSLSDLNQAAYQAN
ncbi:MAG: prolyl oligopeptidase family serine peptidase [Bacteroidales bacterium]